MVRKYLIWAFAIFVAGMMTGFIPKLIHQVRIENAFEEYIKTLSESKDFRSRYLAEIEKILMSMERMKPSEKDQLEKRLSEIKEEIKDATERLAKARKKFCDLAGEEEELCREKQTPAPLQAWSI
ncbi:MAG: hypothetical protein Q8R12_05070 [bacterium]|nr:hypothetical protein [bacterium]